MIVSGIVVVVTCLPAGLGLASCEKEVGAEEVDRKMDQAAESADNQLEATKESMGEKAETAVNYLQDSAITAKVKAEILAEPALKILQIGVTTTDGVVTLSGTVDSQSSLERAAEVAQSNQGVTSAENNLVVK